MMVSLGRRVTGTHPGSGASGRAGEPYGMNKPGLFFGSLSNSLIWDRNIILSPNQFVKLRTHKSAPLPLSHRSVP